MNQNIGFAIIGCGMISRFHISAISKIKNAKLVGMYDNFPGAAQKAAAEHQVKAYATLQEVWEDDQVDAVCICVPSGLHASLACEAITHKKHVILEKPMALSLEDCDKIIALSKEHQVKVSVVSQLRFSPGIQKAKQIVDSGALGRLVSVDLHMKYYRSQAYYDSSDWRGTWAMDGGGALMNQGIHGIDLLLYLAGPVSTVFARSATLARDIEVEDTLSAVTTFEHGALGVIQATTSVYPGFPRRIELCGDRGSILLEEDRIISASFEGDAPCDIEINKDSNAGGYSDPSAIDASGHFMQINNLVNAILYDEPILVDATAGKRAVELVLRIYQSAKEGMPYQFS